MVPDLILAARAHWRRDGARGIVSAVGRRLRKVREKVYLDETHVWYELPLASDRPRVSLPLGLMLIRAAASDTPLLDQLPSQWTGYRAGHHIETGDDLWLVLDGQLPVFACWVLHGSVPDRAATNGKLELPPEIGFLEGATASPSYRGRGFIAPAAFSQIADTYERTGARLILCRIEKDNKVMRLIITKSGFREISATYIRRRGLQQRTLVRLGTGATADWFAEQL